MYFSFLVSCFPLKASESFSYLVPCVLCYLTSPVSLRHVVVSVYFLFYFLFFLRVLHS